PKMDVFWAVFLLCSLLAPSEGLSIMPLADKADGDDIKHSLAKRDLLGGNPLSGLLGKDGAVGSLLGKDGAVGSLLGKDGVLGGLLGGLLGKDGLVGNLLGGNDEDLTGPRIVNNTLPRISLRSMPGFGHQVGFNTQLLVESTSVPGKELCVQVEVDVDMLVQDKWVAPQNDKDCETVEMNIRFNQHCFLIPIFLSPRPNVPLLDQPLKDLLRDVLRELGCDIVNTRLRVVSSLLGSRTPTLPLGALGDLPPFSIISGDSIQLDLNLPVGDMEGSVVASTQGPSLTANLLLATGHPPRLSLSQHALSTLLEPLQERGAFNLSITNSMVPDSLSLSTAALLPLIPQLSRILPGSLPLELRVWVAKEPVVAVNDKKATATLKASVDIVSPALQSSQRPLFSFDTDIVLNIIPSVSDGKLQTSLALDRTRASQYTDMCPLPLQVSPLFGWLKQVLAAAFVPAINDVLQVAVPLPNVLNTSLRNAQVEITDVRIT
ncbi:BPIB3 protein, partial [Eurystomus gularis]|nr:BPIB3 protein [Eurystomus gularis]